VTVAGVARNLRLKRIYDPPTADDGHRVLVTRYWPRGVPRTATDEYTTTLAPSRDLLRAFKHEDLPWEQYVPRYLEEMQSEAARSDIARLAALASERTITILCVCENETRCHRSLLRRLIAEEDSSAARSSRE
jgi:uncharacterized protein YeaO (DUF488 family)